VVNKRGRVLGKPGTVEEAQKMLADLSGSRVTVMSAMVVTNTLTGHCEQDTHCTTLAFDTLPLELIEALAHTEAARTSPGALCIMDERLGRYIDYSGERTGESPAGAGLEMFESKSIEVFDIVVTNVKAFPVHTFAHLLEKSLKDTAVRRAYGDPRGQWIAPLVICLSLFLLVSIALASSLLFAALYRFNLASGAFLLPWEVASSDGLTAVAGFSLAPILESSLGGRKKALLAGAFGSVVEVGAGFGENFQYYTEKVSGVTALEANPLMHPTLQREAGLAGVTLDTLLFASAATNVQAIPEGSIDTVVFTLSLCSIPTPRVSLRQAYLWLKPGGHMLLLEPVGFPPSWLRPIQELVVRVWRPLSGGCGFRSDILSAIQTLKGVKVVSLEQFVAFPIHAPFVAAKLYKLN